MTWRKTIADTQKMCNHHLAVLEPRIVLECFKPHLISFEYLYTLTQKQYKLGFALRICGMCVPHFNYYKKITLGCVDTEHIASITSIMHTFFGKIESRDAYTSRYFWVHLQLIHLNPKEFTLEWQLSEAPTRVSVFRTWFGAAKMN